MSSATSARVKEYDPICRSLTRSQAGALGYLLAPVLTAVMTFAMLRLQALVERMDHIVLPGAGGFVFPVLIAALVGGRGPGILALALAEIVLAQVLMGSPSHPGLHSLLGAIEMGGFPLIGSALIVGMEALRNNTRLLIESEAAQARMSALMGSAPVGVAIVSPSGRVLFSNAEFDGIWGAAFTQRPVSDLAQAVVATETGDYVTFEETPIGRVLSGLQKSDLGELIVELPAGDAVWIEERATMVLDQRGRQLGTLIVVSNISERKLIELNARRAAQREAVISRIGFAIRNEEAPESILHTAASALCIALGVDRCCFAQFDFATHELVIAPDYARAGVKSVAGSYALPEELHADGIASHDGSPISVDDFETAAARDAERNIAETIGAQSAVIAAISEGDAGKSILIAASAQPHQWTTDEVSLVEIVAGQVRNATESAVLRLREHRIATVLQEALRPSLPDAVPGLEMSYHYQPALDEASVGGDFIDIFKIDPEPDGARWAIVIGDVAGKGLSAASQLSTVRTMLRYALTRGEELAHVLQHLSDTLASREWIVGFATMFIGVFDIERMEMEYFSCGHEEAFLRRVADGRIEALVATGSALGAFVGGTFEARRVTLSPGDLLLLYTDGVSDAGPDRHTLLGSSGIKSLLADTDGASSSEAVVQAVRAGVEEFNDGKMRDDVCMLALKMVGIDPSAVTAGELVRDISSYDHTGPVSGRVEHQAV